MTLVILLVAAVAACGSSSSTPAASPSSGMSTSATAAPTSTAGQIAVVKTNWETFFAGSTSATRKIELLQNGQQFAQVIQAQASSPLSKATTATVSAVRIVSPTKATVTYSILQGGQVALPDQSGQAVLQDGVWKVSAKSFSALLKLEGQGASTSPTASP